MSRILKSQAVKIQENDAELDFREPDQTNPTGAARLRS